MYLDSNKLTDNRWDGMIESGQEESGQAYMGLLY